MFNRMIYVEFLILYFKTFNVYFNIGLALSLVAQLIYFLYYDSTSQVNGFSFLNLLNNISLSFISAYIFYFIYPHSFFQTKKAYSFRFYSNRLTDIIQMQTQLHAYLCKRLNQPMDYGRFPNDYIWQEVLKINPNDRIVYDLLLEQKVFSNWFEFFEYLHKLFHRNLTDLLLLKEYIEPDILINLLNIEDTFINNLNRTEGKSFKADNLQVFISGLQEYFNLIIDLNDLFIKEKELYPEFFHHNARKRNIIHRDRRHRRQ